MSNLVIGSLNAEFGNPDKIAQTESNWVPNYPITNFDNYSILGGA
jgi:hypothetical protein